MVENKKAWLIDIALPGENRIEDKEKITKYQNLKTEIESFSEGLVLL